MAKKNILHVADIWDIKLHGKSGNKTEMVLSGRNSKGTEVKVTVDMEDFYLKYMNRDIVTIADQRQKNAIEFRRVLTDQTSLMNG